MRVAKTSFHALWTVIVCTDVYFLARIAENLEVTKAVNICHECTEERMRCLFTNKSISLKRGLACILPLSWYWLREEKQTRRNNFKQKLDIFIFSSSTLNLNLSKLLGGGNHMANYTSRWPRLSLTKKEQKMMITTWTERVFFRPILQTLGWEIIFGWLEILGGRDHENVASINFCLFVE